MPPRLQVEEAFVFLFQCIEASGCKMDFKAVGEAIGLNPAAARMRYSRLKKAVDSRQFRGASIHQPSATLLQDLNDSPETKSTEPIVDDDTDPDETSIFVTRDALRKRKATSGEIVSQDKDHEPMRKFTPQKKTKQACEFNVGTIRTESEGHPPQLLPSHDENTSCGEFETQTRNSSVGASNITVYGTSIDANNNHLLGRANENRDKSGKAKTATPVQLSGTTGRKACSRKAAEAAYARASLLGSSQKQSDFADLTVPQQNVFMPQTSSGWPFGDIEARESVHHANHHLLRRRGDDSSYHVPPQEYRVAYHRLPPNQYMAKYPSVHGEHNTHKQNELNNVRIADRGQMSADTNTTPNFMRNRTGRYGDGIESLKYVTNNGRTAIDVLGLEDVTGKSREGSVLQHLTDFWTK